jgi:undecaprenyl-diphosphatase
MPCANGAIHRLDCTDLGAQSERERIDGAGFQPFYGRALIPLASGAYFSSLRGMPEWIAIVLLGIIEGITEFVPVSSTGHLLLSEIWLPKQTDLFNLVIQCGAVLAVLPLFPERLRQFMFRWREPETRDYLLKLLFAFGVTGVGGLVLDKLHFRLPEDKLPVALALLIGGVLLIAVEAWLKGRPTVNRVTWAIAVAVAIGQLLAIIFPGTSRSGATIVLSLALGLSRPAATEFSFLVGIPTMLAAGGWKLFKALYHPAAGAPVEHWRNILLASVVASVVSFVVVKWLLRYVQTHTFTLFGWYRIAVAAGIGLWLVTSRT